MRGQVHPMRCAYVLHVSIVFIA